MRGQEGTGNTRNSWVCTRGQGTHMGSTGGGQGTHGVCRRGQEGTGNTGNSWGL